MKIFLDLDDVLNDFTIYSMKCLGSPIKSEDDFDPNWGFDLPCAMNATTPGEWTATKIWTSEIMRGVWASAPKSAECNWLIDLAEKLVGRENVMILTSPTLDPECASGKVRWIQESLPKWIQRQYAICPCKHLLAADDAILIDDSDKNVNAFKQAGGVGILMPRRWNSRHVMYQDSFKYICYRLKRSQIIDNVALDMVMAAEKSYGHHMDR